MHCIKRPSAVQGQITSMAWNRGSGNYMLATGMEDGAVYIWTEAKTLSTSDESQPKLVDTAMAAMNIDREKNDANADSDSENLKHKTSPGATPDTEEP